MTDDPKLNCLTCRKKLPLENLPDRCPRCDSPLDTLKSILYETEKLYAEGRNLIRSGDFDSALETFLRMRELHDTPKARKACLFTLFLQNKHPEALYLLQRLP